MEIAAWTAFFGWVGWMVVMIPMGVAWWFFGMVSKSTYKRLRRSYHHYVIQYWLDRLQKEGKRTFQRPD
jgi:hypothetical protein